MILVVPFIITFIFGAAIGGEVENAPFKVFNEDEGFLNVNIGDKLVESLGNNKRLKLKEGYKSWEEVKNDVDEGILAGALYIPKNFSYVLLNTNNSAIMTLYLDPTEIQTRSTIQNVIFSSFEDLGTSAPLQTSIELAFGFEQEPSGFNLAIPAVIPFILNFLVLLITTLTLTRENTYRTKERLFIAPIHPANIVLGYSLALTVLAMMMSIIVLTVGTVVFGATVRGSWLLLILGIVLFGAAFVFLGVFLSTQAHNEMQAVQMGPMIALPSMALSGFLVPIESLPTILQPFAEIVPLTYGIRMTRGIMLKGYGLEELWIEFIVILFFCVFFLLLAMAVIREKE
jgi:ABC-2 type transport system permease protein